MLGKTRDRWEEELVTKRGDASAGRPWTAAAGALGIMLAVAGCSSASGGIASTDAGDGRTGDATTPSGTDSGVGSRPDSNLHAPDAHHDARPSDASGADAGVDASVGMDARGDSGFGSDGSSDADVDRDVTVDATPDAGPTCVIGGNA